MPCCPPPADGPLVAVLAAGAGARFDPDARGAKLDAMLAGKRVGQWALDAAMAAGLAPGVIVVPPAVPAFARESGWPLLANPRADEGLGTSLAIAAGQALAQGRALLVLLADMPLVDPAHLARLAGEAGSAATRWPQGRAGVPARLGLDLLPRAAGVSGDMGAGALLSQASGVTLVDAPEAALLDIDRPEDLAAAAAILGRRG